MFEAGGWALPGDVIEMALQSLSPVDLVRFSMVGLMIMPVQRLIHLLGGHVEMGARAGVS